MQYKTVHFRLIHPSKEISAIYLRFIYDNHRLECSTGMSIPTKHWDKKKKFPSSKIADHDAYKARLDRLEKEVKSYYAKCVEEGRVPSPAEIKEHLGSLKTNQKAKLGFFAHYEAYLQWRLDNKTPERSLQVYRTLLKHLKEFEQKARPPLLVLAKRTNNSLSPPTRCS